jgi:hypothetical protein
VGDVLKNWVKLPSADAESETPGVEKPFILGGAGDADGRGADSVTILAGCSLGADVAGGLLTKMRVNSPGAGPEAWAGAGAAGAKD